MAAAHLSVRHAGPLVTLQDGGRPGRLRFGIPASGPMDRLAHAAGNTMIGNEPQATSIEVSRAGIEIECVAGSLTIAVSGGGFEVVHSRKVHGATTHDSSVVLTLGQNERLAVRSGSRGSWAYIAVAGTIEAKTWLGHTATHTQSGFGGGAVRQGQELVVADARTDRGRDGPIPAPDLGAAPDAIRVVPGPQDHHFESDALVQLLGETWRISEATDRMGVRLEGVRLALKDALSIPSEPIIRGSIQVAGDGVPSVLLADHQTTGGYPKIATIISSDLDRFGQKRPGDPVDFEPVTPSAAIDIARETHAHILDYLHELSQPTLTQRLFTEDLIGWVPPD